MTTINLFQLLEDDGQSVEAFKQMWVSASAVSNYNYVHPRQQQIGEDIYLIAEVDLESGLAEAEKNPE